MSGWTQFEIQTHKIGFRRDLRVLKMVILGIVDLLVQVFLSYEYTLEQVIESILDR